MKIKIAEDGTLYIKRPGGYKKAFCPRDNLVCRDKCALFGEPVPIFLSSNKYLSLCDKVLTCEEIKDLRRKEEDVKGRT